MAGFRCLVSSTWQGITESWLPPANNSSRSGETLNGPDQNITAVGLSVLEQPVADEPCRSSRPQSCVVKWGGVTHVIPNRSESLEELATRLLPVERDPKANDVLVSRVVKIGRHAAMELSCGRKAKLYEGDVIVGAFGNRYATNQYEGCVPQQMDHYHMLSQGAVLGQVVSADYSMGEPTVIQPMGFIDAGGGEVLNLRSFGLAAIQKQPVKVPVLLVLGTSMDAGKTTTAASLVRGLSRAGWLVHAGKLTGTGCAKDINQMRDTGARKILDFTSCGFASTASAAQADLEMISERIIDHLSVGSPDILILEIADGVVQSETRWLSRRLVETNSVNGALVAMHDVMAVGMATSIVEQEFGLRLLGVSGAATRSPLSTRELQQLTYHDVYTISMLSDPAIATRVAAFLASSSFGSVHETMSAVC